MSHLSSPNIYFLDIYLPQPQSIKFHILLVAELIVYTLCCKPLNANLILTFENFLCMSIEGLMFFQEDKMLLPGLLQLLDLFLHVSECFMVTKFNVYCLNFVLLLKKNIKMTELKVGLILSITHIAIRLNA